MEIRIDKVTKMPGLIKAGCTYTLIFRDGNLYLIKTGKFIDFDRIMPHAVTRGIEGYVGNLIAEGLISKMNEGRLKEIEEKEKSVSGNEENLVREKDSFLINVSEIENIIFDNDFFKLKLQTKQGKFKFYFSSVADRSKVQELINNLKK